MRRSIRLSFVKESRSCHRGDVIRSTGKCAEGAERWSLSSNLSVIAGNSVEERSCEPVVGLPTFYRSNVASQSRAQGNINSISLDKDQRYQRRCYSSSGSIHWETPRYPSSRCFDRVPFGSKATISQRYYHATPTREIVPLLAVGLIAGVARYSYRAWQRMAEEEADYLDALATYERQQLRDELDEHNLDSTNSSPRSKMTSTMAIDFGTVFTKIASTMPSLDVVASRQGDRSVFNGIAYETDASTAAPVVTALGRAALERYYYDDHDLGAASPPFVSLPYRQWTNEISGTTTTTTDQTPSFATMVSDILSPRLQDVLDRTEEQETHESDGSNNTGSSRHRTIRPVVTLPCEALNNPSAFTQAFPDVNVFIPEPVAAVWGAQFYNLLPSTSSLSSSSTGIKDDPLYLVVDVGGWTTQISMVQGDVLLQPFQTVTVPLGGEHVVQQLVNMWHREYSTKNDGRAWPLLHTHARSAVAELATHTRVAVSIPYLFADPDCHHLETFVARTVLDAAVQDWIRDTLVPSLNQTNGVLSHHLPTPTELTSLFISVLTHVLERANVLPTNVQAVLVVGGGAKTVLLHQSLSSAWYALTGGGEFAPVVRPDLSRLAELTVLGAATIPPSFNYSIEDGLVRRS